MKVREEDAVLSNISNWLTLAKGQNPSPRLDRCEGEHLETEEQEASRNVKPYTGTPTEGKVKPNTGTPSDHAKPNTGASPSLTMEDGEDLEQEGAEDD